LALLAALVVADSAQAQPWRRWGLWDGGYVYDGVSYYGGPIYGSYYGPYFGRTYLDGRLVYSYPETIYTDEIVYSTPAFAASVAHSPRSIQVLLNVNVPDPTARVWIENQLMSLGGTQREFLSPPLEPGQDYTYTIRASWMDNGREVSQVRSFNVRGGDTVAATFFSTPDRAATRIDASSLIR
jgi:uncharacterized protein (TIGR03000 family)